MANKKPFIFRAWFISQLRKMYRRYPPYYETLAQNKEVYYVKSKHGKDLKRVRHKCLQCQKWCAQKDIRADHIDPVVDPIKGFPFQSDGREDWNVYIDRLYNLLYASPKDNLKKICRECHDVKTGVERKLRTSSRKKPVVKKT